MSSLREVAQRGIVGFSRAAGATDWMGEYQSDVRHRQTLKDAQRFTDLDTYNTAIAGIQSKMATVDPKSAEYASLQGALRKAISARTALFAPETGSLGFHRLGELLHLVKPKPKAAKPGDPTENMASVLEAAALPETENATAQWNTLSGTVNGHPVMWQRNARTGAVVDLTGKPVPTDALNSFVPSSKPTVREVLEPDQNSETGYAKVSYDPFTGEELSRQLNAVPSSRIVPQERTSTTTDPAGVTTTTHSVTRPVYPGKTRPRLDVQSSPQSATTARTPQPTPKKPARTIGELRQRAAAVAGVELGKPAHRQLDANFHIPETDHVNPYLREAANHLLDGMDVSKLPLPQKDRPAAEQLARQYGWQGQGLFTPREQMQLKESVSFLNEAENSPALKALDSIKSRVKLGQLIQDFEQRGVFGQAAQIAASATITSDEAEFLRLYQQLVGTIVGLRQLVQTGKATEASIHRLMMELPNPMTSSSAADGKKRIQRLLKEVQIAQQKGTFIYDAGSGNGRGADAASSEVDDILRALNK